MAFRYSRSRLDKRNKEWVDFIDEKACEEILIKGNYTKFIQLYDIMSDLMAEENEQEVEYERQGKKKGTFPHFMNEDRYAILLIPFKLFGKDAHKELAKWRSAYFEELKTKKSKE